MLLHHCLSFYVRRLTHTHTIKAHFVVCVLSEVHRAAVISKAVLRPSQTGGGGLNECLIGRKLFFFGGGGTTKSL